MEQLIIELSKIRDVKRRRNLLKMRGIKEPELSGILDQVHFINKGKAKFPRAAQMKFDRDGLAQASSKTLVEYRTWKMRQQLGKVNLALDVGSGIGGDTIFMALRWKVISVDIDPQKMEMLHHNLEVYNVTENVETIQGDIFELLKDPQFHEKIRKVDLIFFAPSRRKGWKRTTKFERYIPPLSLVDQLLEICPNLCVEIAPAADLLQIKYDCDIEIISNKGEVKEAVLWFGALKLKPDERSLIATKLPEKITLVKTETPQISIAQPERYFYEPDPAFIKAQLVNNLAVEYDLKLVHPQIAYLTGEKLVETPLLKSYRVHSISNIDYTEINNELSRLDLGRVDSKSRGVNIDHKEIRKHVKGRGRRSGVVIYTLVDFKPKAIIATYV